MLKLITFLSISLLFLTLVSAVKGEVDKPLHENCLYPTILIAPADNRGGYGSGVIIRSDKVDDGLYKNVFLTCAHITDDNSIDYEVRQFVYENWSDLKEVKIYPAIFFSYNRDLDVAIGLFYSQIQMPIAVLDFDPRIFIGNDIFRIGCGLGDDPRLDYGKLTYYKKAPKPTFRTSIMTVPGDSGSPVFFENKVVGIMVSIRVYRNIPVFSISYAVPLDRFRQWNKANNNNLSFGWDKSVKIPEMKFIYLQFKNYEIK